MSFWIDDKHKRETVYDRISNMNYYGLRSKINYVSMFNRIEYDTEKIPKKLKRKIIRRKVKLILNKISIDKCKTDIKKIKSKKKRKKANKMFKKYKVCEITVNNNNSPCIKCIDYGILETEKLVNDGGQVLQQHHTYGEIYVDL